MTDEITDLLGKFVDSQDAKKLLVYQQYVFKQDSIGKTGKVAWRCNESSTCKARLHTMGFDEDQAVIERNTEHNHAAKPARVEVRERINQMKNLAAAQPDKRTRAYFEETYIGMKKVGRGGGRKPPMFSHAAWNVHRRTIDGQPRTSNNVEGWHNAVTYSVLGHKHNHILKVIDGLKLEQSHTQNLNIRLDTGKKEASRKPVYIEMDERINAIIAEYNSEDFEKFLKIMYFIIEY